MKLDDKYIFSLSLQQKFELFWQEYPKKVWKKPVFLKFKNTKKLDFKNLMLWLDLYNEKWKLEETPKQFIPNPLTFLNQERYYDEIIIDESKKEKFKKIIQEKKEIKKNEEEERKAHDKRKELIILFNSLSKEKKIEIQKEAEKIIKEQNPLLFEKKWIFYDNYKKIIIRSILSKLI
jgi:hypothetical protein